MYNCHLLDTIVFFCQAELAIFLLFVLDWDFFLKMCAIKENGKVLGEVVVYSLTGCAISQIQIRDNGD